MIAKATSPRRKDLHDLPMDEFLEAVLWGPDLMPVCERTRRRVLDRFADEQRVGLPRRDRRGKPPRIDADEIREPSERVLRILQMVAQGMSDPAVAQIEGIRKEAIGHILRVLCLPKNRVQQHFRPMTREEIFEYLVASGAVS